MLIDDFPSLLTLLNLDDVGKGNGKGKKATSDDDDFFAHTDSGSEADSKSVKSSSSRSSASSRQSILRDGDDDVMEESDYDKPKKSKAKSSKGKVEKSTKPLAATSQANSGFLTSAERREQGKKDEKKSNEDPYSFLQNVKDVRFCSQSQQSECLLCISERWQETWRTWLRSENTVYSSFCVERIHSIRKTGNFF